MENYGEKIMKNLGATIPVIIEGCPYTLIVVSHFFDPMDGFVLKCLDVDGLEMEDDFSDRDFIFTLTELVGGVECYIKKQEEFKRDLKEKFSHIKINNYEK